VGRVLFFFPPNFILPADVGSPRTAQTKNCSPPLIQILWAPFSRRGFFWGPRSFFLLVRRKPEILPRRTNWRYICGRQSPCPTPILGPRKQCARFFFSLFPQTCPFCYVGLMPLRSSRQFLVPPPTFLQPPPETFVVSLANIRDTVVVPPPPFLFLLWFNHPPSQGAAVSKNCFPSCCALRAFFFFFPFCFPPYTAGEVIFSLPHALFLVLTIYSTLFPLVFPPAHVLSFLQPHAESRSGGAFCGTCCLLYIPSSRPAELNPPLRLISKLFLFFPFLLVVSSVFGSFFFAQSLFLHSLWFFEFFFSTVTFPPKTILPPSFSPSYSPATRFCLVVIFFPVAVAERLDG